MTGLINALKQNREKILGLDDKQLVMGKNNWSQTGVLVYHNPESAAACDDDILSPAYRYMLINSRSSSHTCLMQVAADRSTHGLYFHKMQNSCFISKNIFLGFHKKFTGQNILYRVQLVARHFIICSLTSI